MKAQKQIDKTAWGAGPWQGEPDRKEWRDAATGLPCLAKRNEMGVWCGYVAVAPGHPAHGSDYFDVDVTVHGGLTYGSACSGSICHVPAPGEPDDVFWLGFDCGHSQDLVPAWNADPHMSSLVTGGCYRDIAYVEAQCAALAAQLAAMR